MLVAVELVEQALVVLALLVPMECKDQVLYLEL
jgi:hypothetical protein